MLTFSVAQLMTFSFSAHLQKFNMVAIVVEAFFVTMVDGGAVCGDKENCKYVATSHYVFLGKSFPGNGLISRILL